MPLETLPHHGHDSFLNMPQIERVRPPEKSLYEMCRQYEGRPSVKFTTSVALQPLGQDHPTMSNIKAAEVPFHMIYGSLICIYRLQRDRNVELHWQTPEHLKIWS